MKIRFKFTLFLAFLSDFWAKNRGKFTPKYFFDSFNTRYTLRRLRQQVGDGGSYTFSRYAKCGLIYM
jgi:hypothetical protein